MSARIATRQSHGSGTDGYRTGQAADRRDIAIPGFHWAKGLGETFLYRHLAELVDYINAKNRGIRISLSTNAVLPRFLEQARPLVGKVDLVQVSIDGLEDVYESIRKKASFAALDSNLRTLAQWCKGTRTSIELNMVLTKENYTQMLEVASYARQVGVGRILFSYFNVAATELDNSYYDFYQQEPFMSMLAQLKEIAADNKELDIGLPSVEFNGAIDCPFVWNHFYIAWNGELPPCCVKPFPKAFSLGSVKQRTLAEVLNGPAYQGFRRSWQQKKVPAFCAKCIV